MNFLVHQRFDLVRAGIADDDEATVVADERRQLRVGDRINPEDHHRRHQHPPRLHAQGAPRHLEQLARRDAVGQLARVILPQKEVVVVELNGVNGVLLLQMCQDLRGALRAFRLLTAVRDARNTAEFTPEGTAVFKAEATRLRTLLELAEARFTPARPRRA